MRFFFYLIFIFQFFVVNAQCDSMHFAEIGFEPAYCRIYGYQSGNGVVYASAIGTGPVTYQWTNLATGQQSINTTWGGLNVGEYKIVATDSIGCQITEIVKVDSMNPHADFEIELISESLIGGINGAEITFENKSDNGLYATVGFPEPSYFWWSSIDTTVQTMFWEENFQIQTNTIAPFEICLVSMNKNFCTDTLCKTFSVTQSDTTLFANLNYASTTGDIVVEVNGLDNLILSISDMSGVLVLQQNLVSGLNYFQLYSGYFVYSIVDSQTNTIITSGTIIIA